VGLKSKKWKMKAKLAKIRKVVEAATLEEYLMRKTLSLKDCSKESIYYYRNAACL